MKGKGMCNNCWLCCSLLFYYFKIETLQYFSKCLLHIQGTITTQKILLHADLSASSFFYSDQTESTFLINGLVPTNPPKKNVLLFAVVDREKERK